MKKIFVLILIATFFTACNQQKSENNETEENTEEIAKVGDYMSFGEKITTDGAISQEEMLKKYETMPAGDTLQIKFVSNIKEVCQKKGCWMEMDLSPEAAALVRFKDYGFFVPMNAADSEAIVEGKAYVGETSIADLQHYAKDAGKSEEEIAAITEPKITYNFQASGVLIK